MKASYLVSCAVAAVLCGGATAAAADPAGEAITAGAAAAPSAAAVAAPAAASVGVAEVIVTAQRRNESVQKVPMTLQAFTGQTLSRLNIFTLEDILKYTPNVTYANNGPGQGNIFMRGLSAGFVGNQSSATIASFPNVALYLDDQSMQFPSRNADIFMVDMDRVEVLEGPQGTLFGGGAEAGAVRYITNKPRLGVFEGDAEASYGFTIGGADNAGGHLMVNVPLVSDKLAARLVLYDDHQGGYIDNVPSTLTRSNQDTGNFYLGIGPTNGLCPNGLPPGPPAKGLPNGACTLKNAPVGNNFAIAQKDSNPVDYQGLRFSVRWEINPDWDVLITEMLQNMNAEGLTAQYPVGSDFQKLEPLQNTVFSPSYDKDQIENTAWSVNGKIGPLHAIYTGGYTERHITQQADYTNYARTVGGMEYQCTGPSSYWGNPGPTTCYSPNSYWHDKVRNTHLSNEIRVSSPDDWRIRFIVGAYQENFRIYDIMDFAYKTIPACSASYMANNDLTQFPCVTNLVPTLPGSNITTNDPSLRNDMVAFGEDTQRGYDQYAIFGSVDFDVIPNVLTFTAGTRWYDYNEFEVGSQYSVGAPGIGPGVGAQNTPNGQCGAPCILDINAENYHVTYTGFKSRFSVTWHINEDMLAYFLYSEGFRPGGFNRSNSKKVLKDGDGNPQFHYPGSYAPDSLTNYEVGFKGQFFDHHLQFNVSAYYMNWDNVQFFLYQPVFNINTTFGTNGPSYRVLGTEVQFNARVTDGLTIHGSASYNDATSTKSPCLISNIPGSSTPFGQCVTEALPRGGTEVVPFNNPFGEVGSVPPFSPKWQGNLVARYDWDIQAYKAYAQLGVTYVGGMWNQPASYTSGVGVLIPNTVNLRYYQPEYTTLDAAVGVTRDRYRFEIYGSNLTDSHASVFTSSAQFIKSEVPLRPTVIGMRVGASF
jgi:outer membrane receptor protein involved in Fe transport